MRFSTPPGLDDLVEMAEHALAAIPAPLRDLVRGTAILVEDTPDDETLREMGIESPWELTGLYQGVPLTLKSGGDVPRVTELTVELGCESADQIDAALAQLPERIAVRFALPMIARAWDREELAAQIRHFFDAGHRRWEAANLSALEFIPRADALDLSADWPLYVLNSAALAELRERGVSRFTVSPEDAAENVARLAARHPYALVWPVHRDPPLFISESCPRAAQQGRCPGPTNCDFTEQSYVSKAGEAVKTVNRNCRFYTLLEKPVVFPVPPGLPLIPRADFLYRAWTPDALRQALRHFL